LFSSLPSFSLRENSVAEENFVLFFTFVFATRKLGGR